MSYKKIQTHKDRIWKSNCLKKEEEIKQCFDSHGITHWLVDAVWKSKISQGHTDRLVTDNHFRFKNNSICIAPEFYHIYRCPPIDIEDDPVTKYSCLMNRLDLGRFRVLQKIWKFGLLDQGIVSFNCQYRCWQTGEISDNPLKDFISDNDIDISGYEELINMLPLHIGMDPDQAAMQSQVSLVVETYINGDAISFSEKIFRALQTPRPWLLVGCANSVSVLRGYEFDLLDDIVDHSYDNVSNQDSRLDKIMQQVQKEYQVDIDRCHRAVEHNQRILDKLSKDWPYKLSSVLQTI